MLKSQNIYLFSAICFPGAFVIFSELIVQIHIKNKQITSEFEYLKVLLNAAPDAITFLNEDREIIFQNNQFKLLFNNLENVIEETKLSNFFNQVEYLQKEITIDSNITNDHPFMMSFKLAKSNNRKNYFISFKDLKSLKDKEKIIEEQRNQMIEKNKLASLGEIAAGIAHEVNNPLTVIHSNNSIIKKLMIREVIDKDKIVLMTEKTTLQIERITGIINSLRNLSRGMANEDNEVFCIGQVLSESIELTKLRNTSKKVKIKFENQKFDVYANRGQIVQVIINLMNNAIDAIESSNDPWINLELKEHENSIKLFFEDSGAGIKEEILNKIFLPMYTTKDIGKGTGLGLSLSRSFIEKNNGTLNYIKRDGHTCFVIELPKNADTGQSAA
jgi:C4-dicarboxylate-specific signal transduction histidine kinase